MPPSNGYEPMIYLNEIIEGSNQKEITVGHKPLFNDSEIKKLYDQDYEPNGWNKTELINLINNGNVHSMDDIGHGSSYTNFKLDIPDIDNGIITNNYPFFIFTGSCWGANFDNFQWVTTPYDSIAEHLITNKDGPFAIIGSSFFLSDKLIVTLFRSFMSVGGVEPLSDGFVSKSVGRLP